MSFPRYPKYKDSGVEWLGEVPTHWEIKKLKHVSPELTVGIVVEPSRLYAEEGVPALRSLNVKAGAISLDNLVFITQAGHELHSKSKLRAGDIVAVRTGQPGTSAVIPQELDGCNCIDLIVIRKPTVGSERFLCWYLGSEPALVQFSVGSGGAIQQHFNISTAAELIVAVPPFAEQTAIVAFLDREIAKIDALVAEQQRLIELLNEKRQAVISHAVTKGLNPDAPMKPSGVEWLGEVPAHWEVISIKWLSPVRRGASPRPIDDQKYFDEDGKFAWVRIADVSACDGILKETTQRLSELGSSLSVKIAPGELFVSIAGTVGKPCLSAIDACIHDGFVYFPMLKLDPKFLYRVFEAGTCYGGLGKWGTQLNLNTDTIGSIRVAIPPPDELKRTLEFIDVETAKLDTLTAEAQRAIELLQERRAALISAAVTGQIDVRAIADRAAA